MNYTPKFSDDFLCSKNMEKLFWPNLVVWAIIWKFSSKALVFLLLTCDPPAQFSAHRSFLWAICKTVEIYLCISNAYSRVRSIKPPGSTGPAMHRQCSLYLYMYRPTVMNACSPVQAFDELWCWAVFYNWEKLRGHLSWKAWHYWTAESKVVREYMISLREEHSVCFWSVYWQFINELFIQ